LGRRLSAVFLIRKIISAGLSLVNRKRTEPKKEFGFTALELELELIQTQMAQKPMLRAEVYAHAMRASQNRKKEVRREKEV